ncbi:hypothetical protein MPER_13441, partial [Moniliophthora perniciosa FA553]
MSKVNWYPSSIFPHWILAMAQTSAEVCTLLFSSLVIPADSAYTLA